MRSATDSKIHGDRHKHLSLPGLVRLLGKHRLSHYDWRAKTVVRCMWKEWVERGKTWLTGEGKLAGDLARSPDLPNTTFGSLLVIASFVRFVVLGLDSH
jgi:hypothetical protein